MRGARVREVQLSVRGPMRLRSGGGGRECGVSTVRQRVQGGACMGCRALWCLGM